MAIVIASDIHLARVWDHIAKVLEGHDCINPNENFRRLVQSLDAEDTLVLNGDLVDYQESGYDGGGSNHVLLEEILEGFGGRCLLNAGNHDFRRSAYNLGIYGLKHINVPSELRKKHRREIGFSRFRGLSELRSLRTRHHRGIPAGYPNPKCYVHEHTEADLLFLMSGPDAMTRTRSYLNPACWKVLFREQASLGLDEEQLAFLRLHTRKASEKPLFIFVHAPPIFSAKEFAPITIRKASSSASAAFRKRIFFAKSREFLEEVMASGRNITVFSGHVHVPRQFSIDKETGILSRVSVDETNGLLASARHVKIVTTMPLGAIRKPAWQTGYMIFDEGKLRPVLLRDYKLPSGERPQERILSESQ